MTDIQRIRRCCISKQQAYNLLNAIGDRLQYAIITYHSSCSPEVQQ